MCLSRTVRLCTARYQEVLTLVLNNNSNQTVTEERETTETLKFNTGSFKKVAPFKVISAVWLWSNLQMFGLV